MSKSKTKISSNTSDIISKKQFQTVIENSDDSDSTKKFKRIINLYLENLSKFSENIIPELEVRFGTKKSNQYQK